MCLRASHLCMVDMAGNGSEEAACWMGDNAAQAVRGRVHDTHAAVAGDGQQHIQLWDVQDLDGCPVLYPPAGTLRFCST